MSHNTLPGSKESLQHAASRTRPLFDSVFAAAIGGATVGGYFGVPGMLVGAVIGGVLGYRLNKHSHAD
jgi:ribose/xylose/arabinose/galactoside ABC-type transport system permease subunit